MIYSYIFGAVLGLFFLIGCVRTALCWPAVRFEMTRQSQEPSICGYRAAVHWILPRPLCYLIYSSAWIMWRREYRDMRASSKLERLSAKTRNNS
jgi:hypothetical protein